MSYEDEITSLPEEAGSASSLFSAGQMFGQYRFIRQLGRGGMGEVYEVEHLKLGSRHAIKLINQEIAARASVGQRFEREAKVMARLAHPNIVKVDDFGETDGRTWLRMELVGDGLPAEALRAKEGDLRPEVNSLSDLLQGEPLPEAQVVDLLKQILDGLAYAHEQGVVHRDLKPSNILLSPNPRDPNAFQPKITDFGLVRLVGEQWLQSQVELTVARSIADSTGSAGSPQAGSRQADPHSASSGQADATRLDGSMGSAGSPQSGTSTRAILGTFEFMSPEQRKGQEADARSDLYSIGLIAFRMLTGEDSPGMEMPSQLIPGLNPAWDAWVVKSLKGQADARFGSAAEMLENLPGLGAPPTVKRTQQADFRDAPAANVREAKSKLPWLSLLCVLLIIAGASGYYFGIYVPEQTREAEQMRVQQAEASARQNAERTAEAKARQAAMQLEAARLAETERVRAEQEAARIASEQEAARIVAEQEAARLAAEREAERRLAAQREVERVEAESKRLAAEKSLELKRIEEEKREADRLAAARKKMADIVAERNKAK